MRELPTQHQHTASIAHEPRAVSQARQLLQGHLVNAHISVSLSHDAVTVFAELLTNALRHAEPRNNGTIGVRWIIRADEHNAEIYVEVTDGGRHDDAGPEPRISITSDPTGRGLWIVEEIATTWGVRGDSTGRTVWAEIRE